MHGADEPGRNERNPHRRPQSGGCHSDEMDRRGGCGGLGGGALDAESLVHGSRASSEEDVLALLEWCTHNTVNALDASELLAPR